MIADLLKYRVKGLAPDDDGYYVDSIGFAGAGGLIPAMSVSPDQAMMSEVFCSGVRFKSRIFGSLPCKLYERTGDNGKREAKEQPLYDVMARRPNNWQSPFEFKEMMFGHFLQRGQAIARIVSGKRGAVDQIIPLHPDHVKAKQSSNGSVNYEWKPRNENRTYTLSSDEVLHIRDFSTDGVTGISVIKQAAMAVGLNLGATQFISDFFKNNATPGVAFKHPGQLSDPAYNRLKGSLIEPRQAPGGRWAPILLEEGMDVATLGLTPEDSLLLGVLNLTIEGIARILNIPPHMLGHTEKVTSWGTGVEQLSIGFVVYSVAPDCVRWEEAYNRDLIVEYARYYFKFNLRSLLRGDFKGTMEAFERAINCGIITRNEAREWLEMNPDDDLDFFSMPLNMQEIGTVSDKKTSAQEAAAKLIEEDQKFKQNVFLKFLDDRTTNDVVFNMVNVRKLLEEVGIEKEPGYIEPWLPVTTEPGPIVTGEALKDSEGDIVGGKMIENPKEEGKDLATEGTEGTEEREEEKEKEKENNTTEDTEESREPREARGNARDLRRTDTDQKGTRNMGRMTMPQGELLISDLGNRVKNGFCREMERHLELYRDDAQKFGMWLKGFTAKFAGYVFRAASAMAKLNGIADEELEKRAKSLAIDLAMKVFEKKSLREGVEELKVSDVGPKIKEMLSVGMKAEG